MQGLQNISPIDGRYQRITALLQPFFSEEALIKYRVGVEVDYFIALCRIPLPPMADVSEQMIEQLRNIHLNFSGADAQRVKAIEETTNHDIKAVEYFIKEKMESLKMGPLKEFVHFGLTSQDVNNTAIPRSFKEAMEAVIFPALDQLLAVLKRCTNEWLNLPMLARTHGQPASPTTLGKEFMVFHERLSNQIGHMKALPYPAKFGGATGNFNAHHVAYPHINWVDFAEKFTNEMGLLRSRVTTQIDHYDGLSALFDNLKRMAVIITDLDRDCWTYISQDYFKQKIKEGEVGSSAMPHKVNPIDFENAEGNAGLAIAVFEHLSAKLPISRLQRDLTDSTVLRNIGVPIAHLLIAIKASIRGLNKLEVNQDKISQDLEQHVAVVAEAIQTILRTLNYPNPYEALKALTRKNKALTMDDIHAFIGGLDIDEEQKERLWQITPFNYTGILPGKID